MNPVFLLSLLLLLQCCVMLTAEHFPPLLEGELESLKADEEAAMAFHEPNFAPVRVPRVRDLRARSPSGGTRPTSTSSPTRPSLYCASLVYDVNATDSSKCNTCVSSNCVWCESGDYCFSGSSACSNSVSGSASVCSKLSISAAVAIIIISVILPILFCCAMGAGAIYFFYYSTSRSVAPAVGYNQNFGSSVGQPQGVQMGAYSQVPHQQGYVQAQPYGAQQQAYGGQPVYPAQAYGQQPQQAYPVQQQPQVYVQQQQAYPPQGQAYPPQAQAYPQQAYSAQPVNAQPR